MIWDTEHYKEWTIDKMILRFQLITCYYESRDRQLEIQIKPFYTISQMFSCPTQLVNHEDKYHQESSSGFAISEYIYTVVMQCK